MQLADNRVTVSFGETLADADNIDQAYRRFKSTNVGIDDVLRRQGNALDALARPSAGQRSRDDHRLPQEVDTSI